MGYAEAPQLMFCEQATQRSLSCPHTWYADAPQVMRIILHEPDKLCCHACLHTWNADTPQCMWCELVNHCCFAAWPVHTPGTCI